MGRNQQYLGMGRRLAAAAIGLLLISTLIAAAAPPAAATSITSWSWNAPADADGPGAFRVTVDFGAANRCDMMLTGTGGMGNGPVARVSVGADYWGSIHAHHFVQAHSSDLDVDTREIDGAVGIRIFWYDPIAGVETLTVLVTDMLPLDQGDGDDKWYAAQFGIDCDAPFEIVGFSGSREAVGFNDMSLEGTGANAGGAFVPGVSVHLDDTLQRSFSSGAVEVDIQDFDTTAEVRSWDLVTPTQSFEGMSSDLSIEDGPGDYLFSLTGVGDGPGSIGGWMAGYESVGSLGDILG